MLTPFSTPIIRSMFAHQQYTMSKRNTPSNDSDLPPSKRQTKLGFSASVTAYAEAVAEPVSTETSCRFLSDGYIEALVKRHRNDERYREFFNKNDVEVISKLLRECFTPALLGVLNQRREDDHAA
jgi:hypothetical protein